MPKAQPIQFFRLLLVEDDIGRVQDFRALLPDWARLVWTQSAGAAMGLIRRDHGHVYGAVMLDHALGQRPRTQRDEQLSGSDVALAILEHFSNEIPILIHSTNQVEVPRIARQLEEKGFWVTRIPYHELTDKVFLAWLDEARAIWEDRAAGRLPDSW